MRTVAMVGVLLAVGADRANAVELQWQARVLTPEGAPLDATADVTVALRAGALPTDPLLWSDTFSGVVVEHGLLHLVLGSAAPLDVDAFPADGAWIQVDIADAVVVGPMRLPSTAYAVRALSVGFDDAPCDAAHVGTFNVIDGRQPFLCGPDGWMALAATWEHEHEPWALPAWPSGGNGEFRGLVQMRDGNVAAAGYIFGAGMDGVSSQGTVDSFVRVTSGAGALVWNGTLGDPGSDRLAGIAQLDGGDVVAVGYTDGNLPGFPDVSSDSGIVGRWTPDGTLVSWDQLNNIGIRRLDAVCSDGAGGYYVGGYADGWLQQQNTSGDIALVRYSADNQRLWTHRPRWSTFENFSALRPLPGGGVIALGMAQSGIEGATFLGGHNDIFIQKIDGDGNVLAHRQFGTADYEYGYGLDVRDDGIIVISGHTGGSMPGWTDVSPGNASAFVAVLEPDLSTRWIAQLNTAAISTLPAVTWDRQGRVHAVGNLDGGYNGTSTAGRRDQLYVVFDDQGTELYSDQRGSSRADHLWAVDEAKDGDILMGGGYTFSGSQLQGDLQRRANLP